jgi:hypothetical protein
MSYATTHDPASMSPDERFRELGRILAVGLLRSHAYPPLAADPGKHPNSKNLPKTGRDCLEVPAETVLSVHTS